MGGLSLGILLADIGLRVIIADPAPAPSIDTPPSGRTVALMNSSVAVIKACGIWDDLAPLSNPLKQMRIIDDSLNPPIPASFPASDIGHAQYGYNIPNGPLRFALYTKAAAHKAITIIPSFVKNLQGNTVTLDNGDTIQAGLIVGADGRNSTIRQQSGIKSKKKDYDQAAITCLLSHSKPHNDTANEFHREHGPFALVPLPNNHSSLVWVETRDKADALLKLDKSSFTEHLQACTKDILGTITLASNPESWPLCTIKAEKLTAPHVALIAEAAHVMSPITAQGLNLSLRDVATLAELIADHVRLGLSPGDSIMLNTYEQRRRLDIATRIGGVDKMNMLVSTDILPLKSIRRSGLKLVDKIPAIKRLAMRHGLAPSLDIGRLAKGETL